MRIQPDMPEWLGRLFACEDIGGTSRVLATALGHIANGEAAGVFLLDADKSKLFLFGSWSASGGEYTEEMPRSVPTDHADDPLCFCLLNGAPYQAVLNPAPTMDLLGLGRCNVYAMPLRSRLNGALGGILIAAPPARAFRFLEDVQAITMYAALILENMIQKKNSSFIIDDLRNDIEKFETQTRQKSQLAAQIIGNSQAIAHVRNLIAKAAPTNATVLITGETGTGKEFTAEAIHELSPRRHKPFLKINCGALSPQLLESELFGHVKGAFTGAYADNAGLLHSAKGGSVLLDEIGDMPVSLQVKLLRVLQDKKVRPVGGIKDSTIDIRIMAATNKNLHAAMDEGIFRQDLYHRIAAFDIHIPPLRERRQDIPELTLYFFDKLCKMHNRTGLNILQEDILYLSSLQLPGNVRELTNMIERAILLAEPGDSYVFFNKSGKSGNDAKTFHLNALLKDYETDLIIRCLKRNFGNITKTAETLCIPRTTLRAKIQKFKLGQYISEGKL